jgi:anti-anti-sigma regulatory factor
MDQHRPVSARPTCPLHHPHTGAPAFGQVVDGRLGSIRAHGDLTRRTADQLRGTVEALLRNGHRRVVLDLGSLQSADEPGMRALRTLQAAVDADGGRLALLGVPEALLAADLHDDGMPGRARRSPERGVCRHPSGPTAPAL